MMHSAFRPITSNKLIKHFKAQYRLDLQNWPIQVTNSPVFLAIRCPPLLIWFKWAQTPRIRRLHQLMVSPVQFMDHR